jgi:hypothetical protein
MSTKKAGSRKEKDLDPAIELADSIGKINSTLALCIRSMRTNNAPDAPRGGLDEVSLFEVNRYMNASSVRIPVFFAAMTRLESLRNTSVCTTDNLIQAFNAYEIANIMALIYVFKRLRSRVEDSEDWGRISKAVSEHIEIGASLGRAIPTVGFADGILVGGIRHMALGTLVTKDPKGYKDYRRDLKIANRAFDLNEEKARWGTTHLDIAARLLILLGFNSTYAINFMRGTSDTDDSRLNDDQLRFRLIAFWIESLSLGVAPPRIRGEEKHGTSDEKLDALFNECALIRSQRGDNCWISKGKKDVSPESYPQLFSGGC